MHVVQSVITTTYKHVLQQYIFFVTAIHNLPLPSFYSDQDLLNFPSTAGSLPRVYQLCLSKIVKIFVSLVSFPMNVQRSGARLPCREIRAP